MKIALLVLALSSLFGAPLHAATADTGARFCDGKGNCMTEAEYQAYLEAPEYHCNYYTKYIWKESERPYGKRQYAYTDESLRRIAALRDEGVALCEAGRYADGEERLRHAIKIISFTPPAH